MPLHTLQRLSPTAVRALWHLQKPEPRAVGRTLPQATAWKPPARAAADATRQVQWLAGRNCQPTRCFRNYEVKDKKVQCCGTTRPAAREQSTSGPQPVPSHSEWVAAVLTPKRPKTGIDDEMIDDKANGWPQTSMLRQRNTPRQTRQPRPLPP
jgi:hypothetical protein